MNGEKVLVVEDEKSIAKALQYNLEKENFRVTVCFDGQKGLDAFRKERPGFVILDLMLPKLDGFEFCRTVRQESPTPILMLTARTDEVDRILGLEMGADDYVTKPFSIREVLTRVKTILRRAGPQEEPAKHLRAGELEVDLERRECRVAGKTVTLRFKEFEFLKCLFLSRGKVLAREQLLEKVWGYDESIEISSRTIDQHITRLRKKLGPESRRIVTVKNVGYKFETS